MKREPLIAGAIAFCALAVASGLHPTVYNNYVLLADAFLHGHAAIAWPGEYIDALEWNGARYVIEAPLPAILLLPLVAIAGTAANQTLLSALLGAVAVGAGSTILVRLAVPLAARVWLCGFLLLGTDLFWAAMLGDVWFLAHVAAAAFTLLALAEILGERRGWLVALYAACAIESRFALVAALPVYAALMAYDAPPAVRKRRILEFAGVLLPFAGLWVAYNMARWGVPYDIGYTEWYHRDRAGEPSGSPFRLAYLPNQLYSFFVRFPDVLPRWPFLVPTYNGVALTWTSPALVIALFARTPRPLVVAMWAAFGLTALPNLIYYVNGYAQFGMRHALDFEPFLFVLMGLAARRGLGIAGATLCAWSMLAGTWGIWFWKAFYHR